MRKIGFTSTAIATLIGGAIVGISGASAQEIIDPTDLHVSNTTSSSPASNTDPVLLGSTTEFFVINNNNATINTPIYLYFAVPYFSTMPSAPTVTSVELNDSEATPLPAITGPDIGTLFSESSSESLYQIVQPTLCATGCGGSISIANFKLGDGKAGIPDPTTGYEIYTFTVDTTLPGSTGGTKNYLEVDGSFAVGTYIAPFGEDVVTNSNGDTTTTVFDTSFTNAGMVTGVPESSTWAMMALGFMGLGFAAFHRSRGQSISAFD